MRAIILDHCEEVTHINLCFTTSLHRVVHKDAQGFDDIDEFWVDDEEEKSVFDEKEENEVEDCRFLLRFCILHVLTRV